jgi:hypothetical protein
MEIENNVQPLVL